MKYTDLLPFCSKDFSRIALTAPILIGDWLYAADGHICIRSKGITLPDGFGKVPPKDFDVWPDPDDKIIKTLPSFFEGEPTNYRRILFFPELNPRIDCEPCAAQGRIPCDHCEHANECPVCFGSGYKQEDIRLDLGGVFMSGNLLDRILSLPYLEIALNPKTPLRGQRFRFRGGEGIITPLKYDGGSKEYLPFNLFEAEAI